MVTMLGMLLPQEDVEVVVGQDDLMAAAAVLQPSLSPAEIARYTSLRDSYSQQRSR